MSVVTPKKTPAMDLLNANKVAVQERREMTAKLSEDLSTIKQDMAQLKAHNTQQETRLRNQMDRLDIILETANNNERYYISAITILGTGVALYALVNRYFTKLAPASTLFLVALPEPMAVVIRTVYKGFKLRRRSKERAEQEKGLRTTMEEEQDLEK